MKNMLYKQCKLRHGENLYTTSWIPEKFAVEGKLLSIRDDQKHWSNWTVIFVGSAQEDPPDVRDLIKGHRKMTGDDTPKIEKEK